MKKRIDPDKFLDHIAESIERIKWLGEKAKKEGDTKGVVYFSNFETALYGVKCAIEYATVSDQKSPPGQPPRAKSYPHAFSDEHRNLLELRDECRTTIKVGVDIAFSTREEWRELYETGKYIGCVPPNDEIPMLKDYIVKKIIESKEIDEKIEEIEKGAAKWHQKTTL